MTTIHRAENGQIYFTIEANNNKTVATSKMYDDKDVCMETVRGLPYIDYRKIKDLTTEPPTIGKLELPSESDIVDLP